MTDRLYTPNSPIYRNGRYVGSATTGGIIFAPVPGLSGLGKVKAVKKMSPAEQRALVKRLKDKPGGVSLQQAQRLQKAEGFIAARQAVRAQDKVEAEKRQAEKKATQDTIRASRQQANAVAAAQGKRLPYPNAGLPSDYVRPTTPAPATQDPLPTTPTQAPFPTEAPPAGYQWAYNAVTNAWYPQAVQAAPPLSTYNNQTPTGSTTWGGDEWGNDWGGGYATNDPRLTSSLVPEGTSTEDAAAIDSAAAGGMSGKTLLLIGAAVVALIVLKKRR